MAQLRRVGDIQVLRAVAIGLVLAHHLSLSFTLKDLLPIKANVPFWLGVELFFVISGLVVTQSVLDKPFAPFKFLSRRLFRLIPAMLLFFVVSGVVCLLAAALPGTWVGQNVATTLSRFVGEELSILGGYFINTPGPKLYVNGAMWSLSVEFQFYAAFAAMIGILYMLRSTTASAKPMLFAVSAGLYVAVLVQRIGILSGHDLLQNPVITYIRVWRMDFMLLGIVVALLPLRRVVSGPVLTPYLLLLPLGATALSEGIVGADSKPMLNGFTMPFMGFAFALLLYLARSDSAFPGKESAIYRALGWLGDRSYSLYLLHFPVMAIVWMLFYWFAPWVFNGAIRYGFAQALFVIPISIFAAHLSFEFVEKPARKLGQVLLENFERPKIAAEPAVAQAAA